MELLHGVLVLFFFVAGPLGLLLLFFKSKRWWGLALAGVAIGSFVALVIIGSSPETLMELLHGLVALFFVVAGPLGLLLLFFKSKRRWGLVLVVGAIGTFVALAIIRSNQEDEARRMGFASALEQRRAKRHGIADPEAWKVKATEIEAQAAKSTAAKPTVKAPAQRATHILGVPIIAAQAFRDPIQLEEEDFACVRRGQQLEMQPTGFAIMRNVIYDVRRDGIEQAVLECRKTDDRFLITTKPSFDQSRLLSIAAEAGTKLFGAERDAVMRAVEACRRNVRSMADGNSRSELAGTSTLVNCSKSDAGQGFDGRFEVVIGPMSSPISVQNAPTEQLTSCKMLLAGTALALGGDGTTTSYSGPCVKVSVLCGGTHLMGVAEGRNAINIQTTCASPSTAVRAGIVSSLQAAVAPRSGAIKPFVDACFMAMAARRTLPEDKRIGSGLLVCTGLDGNTIEFRAEPL